MVGGNLTWGYGGDGAEESFGTGLGRQWGSPSHHPQTPEPQCQILLEMHVLGQCQSNQRPLH